MMTPWLAAILATPGGSAPSAAELTVTQATEVDGQPLPRPLVGVATAGGPTLPFHVRLEYRCPPGTGRQQLFVSIADTTRLEDATASPSPRVIRIDVPFRELPWLTQPATSCNTVSERRRPDEVDSDGTRFFRMHAGAAGFATLTCWGADGAATEVTSITPLDVWLSCPANPGTPPPPP
jgi:hypothetical protein